MIANARAAKAAVTKGTLRLRYRPMAMTPHNALPSPLARVVSALLRAGLAVLAALVMIGALVLGLAVAAGVVVWALLRGKRPVVVNLRPRAGSMPRAGTRRPVDDVVDVTVREIEPPPR